MDWQQERTRLNHDWLQNIYLPSLDTWVNILHGRVRNPGFEDTFLQQRFLGWGDRSFRFRDLIEQAEAALRPSEALRAVANSTFLDESAWVSLLVDGCWDQRVHFTEQLASIRTVLDDVDTRFDVLRESVRKEECRAAEVLDVDVAGFEGFRDACLTLSRMLSALPRDCEVV